MSRYRIGLLTAVTLVGMGLAACLGLLTGPTPGNAKASPIPTEASWPALADSRETIGPILSGEPKMPSPPLAAAPGEPSPSSTHDSEDDFSPPTDQADAATFPDSEKRLTLGPNVLRKSRDLEETMTAPKPVWAPPLPSVTYQIQAPPSDSALLELLGALRERLGADAEDSRAESSGESGGASQPSPPSASASNADAPSKESISESKSAGKVDDLGNHRFEIHFNGEDIRLVLEAVSEQAGLNIVVSDAVQGSVTANFVDVDALEALDAILKSTGFLARREGEFLFVGAPEDFSTMEKTLDRIATRIYRPQYVTATELQTLITPLLSEDIGFVSISSAADVGIAADGDSAGGDSYAGDEVLLIRDYSAVLTEVDQIIAEVDTKPLQVIIEATILSVKLDDETKMGVSFEFFRNNPNVRFGIGSPLNNLPSALDKGGLQFAFLDSNLGEFIEALESIQDTNVIATPRVMVLNKHRAEVQIGKSDGYVNSTVTETSTSQSVAFLDTGTILRLRPFISPDGVIRMELHPELSTGEVQISQQFTIPKKEVTQVTTNVMVRDGCTVIIGGLIREQVSNGNSQVPLLGSLPLVGPIFRTNQNQSTVREEILILLTPHIVREPDVCNEGSLAACEFHRRRDVMAEKTTPFSRDHLSRQYVRLAENAWAQGDRERALWYAEMAVHFSPGNRAAIDLRSNIWLNQAAGGHTLVGPGALPTATSADADSEELPPWVLHELENDNAKLASPSAAPRDRTSAKKITKPGGWR